MRDWSTILLLSPKHLVHILLSDFYIFAFDFSINFDMLSIIFKILEGKDYVHHIFVYSAECIT